jgi:hypothetical protein
MREEEAVIGSVVFIQYRLRGAASIEEIEVEALRLLKGGG